MTPKGCLAGPREDRHAEACVPLFLRIGELCEHALWPLCPLFGNVQVKVFLLEGMTRPARVSCRPFEQPEVYAGQRWGHCCYARCAAMDRHYALSELQVPSRGRGLLLEVCLWSSGTVLLISARSLVVSLWQWRSAIMHGVG